MGRFSVVKGIKIALLVIIATAVFGVIVCLNLHRLSKMDAERASTQWHAWWRAHNSTFTPPRAAPCHDW